MYQITQASLRPDKSKYVVMFCTRPGSQYRTPDIKRPLSILLRMPRPDTKLLSNKRLARGQATIV